MEERALRLLRKELANEDKQQNVSRIKRMGEFMRLQTLSKLEQDNMRTQKIREEKDSLREQRKKMQHENFLRKAAVKEAMDQMKVTNKYIDIEDVLAKKTGKKKRSGPRDVRDDDDY